LDAKAAFVGATVMSALSSATVTSCQRQTLASSFDYHVGPQQKWFRDCDGLGRGLIDYKIELRAPNLILPMPLN
jgi:hypothetical protein